MRKSIVAGLVLIVFAGVGFYLWENCHLISSHCCKLPSDEELLVAFENNPKALESLLELARSDADIRLTYQASGSLDVKYQSPQHAPSSVVLSDRLEKSETALKELKIRNGFQKISDDGSYRFTSEACGHFQSTDTTGTKGYAFLTAEPKLLVDSLDSLKEELAKKDLLISDTDVVYRSIGNNWYLFRTF